MEQQEQEQEVLRRVFGLCYLNTIQYATYRHQINPNRSNDSSTAQDYTNIDYNYVSIKRKEMSLILQAIVTQPGLRLESSYINKLIEQWSNTQSDIALPSYTLDTVKGRLVKVTASTEEKRPLVLIDQCPRTNNVRVSFLVSFLKNELPDLMGESKVDNLTVSFSCVNCFKAVRDCILMPCNHVILCSKCSETLQPVECFVCRTTVQKIEKIYFS